MSSLRSQRLSGSIFHLKSTDSFHRRGAEVAETDRFGFVFSAHSASQRFNLFLNSFGHIHRKGAKNAKDFYQMSS